MPISEKDIVWIEEPELSFWEQTFLPAVAGGLKVAIKHTLAQHSVTEQFPEQRPDLPLNYRGVHRLNRDEQGRVRCVACMMCATACPAHCISIVAEDASKEWPDRDKRPLSFALGEELLKVHVSYGPLVKKLLARFNKSAIGNRQL